MIGVITASKTSGSVLGYDFGDKKDKDQKIHFLASEGVILDARQVDRLNQNWTDASSLKEFKFISRSVADDLSKQFDSQASVNDRIVRTTGHIALSFSPLDRERLQDDEFKIQVATEYMEEMGITDTQWVLVEHEGTNAPHLHVAYNRVKYDGTVIDSKNERYRSQKIAAELSEKYGLTPAGETPRMEKSLTPEQQQFEQMRLLAREVLQESCTMEEFKNNLRKRGIELRLSEHSEQQRSYGISYAMGEISAKGSKLDRSALSFAKVSSTLDKNLAARVAVEQANVQKATEEAKAQERAKAKELHEAYGKMVPTIKGLDSTVRKAFELYKESKDAGVAISSQTTGKYTDLKNSWTQFHELNKERNTAQTAKELSKAIGGMLIFLNPLAGLLVMAIGSIATDIRISSINADKKALLGKIEGIKSDIDTLKIQKAQINIEKKERLDEYLHAKDTRNEFRQGMDAIKSEINALKEQTTKKEVTMEDLAKALSQSQKTRPENPIASTEKKPAVENPNLDGRIIGSLGRNNIAEVKQALMYNDIILKPVLRQDGAITSFNILHTGKRYKMEDILKPSTISVLFNNWERLTGQRSAVSVDKEAAERLRHQPGYDGHDEGPKHGGGRGIGGGGGIHW